jgi:Thiolase, C-terminal domain
MGIGPSIAIPKVLAKVGITTEDVDLFEVQYSTIYMNKKGWLMWIVDQ